MCIRDSPYDVFLNDLVNKLVQALKDTHADPEFISQRKAYKLFGRRNVDRWRRQGKVVCYKRPGKVEYKTADLRMLQKTTQDYFESPPLSSITSIKKTVKHTKYELNSINKEGKGYQCNQTELYINLFCSISIVVVLRNIEID